MKVVRVTDKGQLSIPIGMREAAKIQKGDDVILLQEGNRIIMEKVDDSRFEDLLKHSEAVAAKMWSGPEDDVWDKL